MEQKDSRFAVLIDADNVSPKYIKYILDEVSDQGVATYKRIYGDWTDISKKSWKEQLLRYSINPIQQYSNTNGKNSTDSAMIIDAMDILYSGNCDGFVLVSSDSDFTRLAVRLREAGMKVYGMGEKKTPKPFIVACDKFVYIEVIRSAAQQERAEEVRLRVGRPMTAVFPQGELSLGTNPVTGRDLDQLLELASRASVSIYRVVISSACWFW